MRNCFVTPLCFLLLTSCGFRMTDNDERVKKPTPNAAGQSITVIALGDSVAIMGQSVILSRTTIESPTQTSRGYDLLLTYAQAEAVILGGNVVKVEDYHGLSHSAYLREALYVTIYRVNDATLAGLKTHNASVVSDRQDSIKYITIAHIKSFDEMGARRIWFNDSLVGQIKGRGFDGLRGMQRKELVFHSDGLLELGDDTVRMETGKEYYIVLYCSITRHGYLFHKLLTDKIHFDNRSMILEGAKF